MLVAWRILAHSVLITVFLCWLFKGSPRLDSLPFQAKYWFLQTASSPVCVQSLALLFSVFFGSLWWQRWTCLVSYLQEKAEMHFTQTPICRHNVHVDKWWCMFYYFQVVVGGLNILQLLAWIMMVAKYLQNGRLNQGKTSHFMAIINLTVCVIFISFYPHYKSFEIG